jgi:hypothetical protein
MTYLFNDEVDNDAFGRIRVSDNFTLGDYKHLYGIDPNFIEKTTNGATITYQHDKCCARLTTSNTASSSAIHQTKFYHHYMPGKSQLIYSSFNFYSAVPNVTKRTGYFDDKNGIFFEQTGDSTLNIVLRTFVNGIVEETRVPQSQWNNDKCDGTGASDYVLDISKTQLCWIDFQWLGVGRARVGFAHNGVNICAHTFNGSNQLTTVYMSNPNLPIICELTNTGPTTGAFFDQICSTVMSEGGYVEAGQDWAISTPFQKTIPANSSVSVPIMAIKLKNKFQTYDNRMIARMGNLNVFSSGENIKYSLIKLPDISQLLYGTNNWISVNDASGVEYMTNCYSYTDGSVIDVGFVAASTQGSQRIGGSPGSNLPSTAKKNYIVQNYDSSNSEIFMVAATNLGASSTQVSVGMQWREIY